MSNEKNELFGQRLVYNQNDKHGLDKSSLKNWFSEITINRLAEYSQSIANENSKNDYLYKLSHEIIDVMSKKGLVLLFNDRNNNYIAENINTKTEKKSLMPILDDMFQKHLVLQNHLQKQFEGKDDELIETTSFLSDIGLPHTVNETWEDRIKQQTSSSNAPRAQALTNVERLINNNQLNENSSKNQGRF